MGPIFYYYDSFPIILIIEETNIKIIGHSLIHFLFAFLIYTKFKEMQDIYYFNLYDIDVHFNLIAFTGQRPYPPFIISFFY